MTTIQAIDLLKGLEQSLDDYCELNDEGKTAFRMAITALEVFGLSEQLPSVQPTQNDRVNSNNPLDCISRAAAIKEFSCCELTPDGGIDVNYAIDFLNQLPSVQPDLSEYSDKLWRNAYERGKTEAEIQKMQDLEQAEIQKAYELGKLDAMDEIVKCKDCKHKHIENSVWVCPFGLPGGPEFFCGYGSERREE